MPDLRIVQFAERSPTCCVACGTNQGPFIDLDVTTFTVPTASGFAPIVDGSVYLCIGQNDGTAGCAVQIGRLTGRLVDIGEYENALSELGAVTDKLNELQPLLRKKTISLEDAEKIMAPAGDF